jgi:hypothetical protein
VAVKEGIDNQRYDYHLTIGKCGRWTAVAPDAIVLFEGLIGIIDQGIPDGPDILPARICDRIDPTSHGRAAFRGLATRRML